MQQQFTFHQFTIQYDMICLYPTPLTLVAATSMFITYINAHTIQVDYCRVSVLLLIGKGDPNNGDPSRGPKMGIQMKNGPKV